MQNGFLHGDGSCASAGFPVASLAAAIGPCRTAIGAARRAGVPVIYTRFTYRADFRDGGFMLREKFPMLQDAGALVAGSWDQAVLEELSSESGDFVVDKNRPSGFYATPLETYLAGLEVRDLVVCGVTTNCCVESTVRDAAQRDFRTFVLTDACAEWDPVRHEGALVSMGSLFAHLLTTAEVERTWSTAAR